MMDFPEMLRLIELGPGRGTLMRDALRAVQVVPNFHSALSVHLVEVSPLLAQKQRELLNGFGVPITWHQSLDQVPDGPTVVIANEFFDALPVYQAVKHENGWHERVVEIDRAGNLAFTSAADTIPQFERLLPARLRNAPDGAFYEWRPDRAAIELGRRIVRNRGAALVIDYGYLESGLGETLQAVGEHSYANPLAAPGVVDLTAHVDFQALRDGVESMGARTYGPLTQGEFLRRLGIEMRAQVLKAHATPDVVQAIDEALMRLTGTASTDMGELFKVMAFADPTLQSLPGFEA